MRFQTAVISGRLRRALLRRLGGAAPPSGLFFPVCVGLAGGVFAAVDAGPEAPGFALDSIWLYRAEVGLAFMGAIYIAGLILWLAWHGRGFLELGAFGLTVKASEIEDVRSAGSDSSGAEKEIVRLQGEAADGILELNQRVSALEAKGPPARI